MLSDYTDKCGSCKSFKKCNNPRSSKRDIAVIDNDFGTDYCDEADQDHEIIYEEPLPAIKTLKGYHRIYLKWLTS